MTVRDDDDQVEKTLLAVSVTTRLDATDVVGQPALDLAGARLGEEAQRHRCRCA